MYQKLDNASESKRALRENGTTHEKSYTIGVRPIRSCIHRSAQNNHEKQIYLENRIYDRCLIFIVSLFVAYWKY